MTHSITPPPELVVEWASEWMCTKNVNRDNFMATRAAQWGADQELEACCALMDEWGLDGNDLMECRRPKPPSLKKQALADLSEIGSHYIGPGTAQRIDTIRRALEALPE